MRTTEDVSIRRWVLTSPSSSHSRSSSPPAVVRNGCEVRTRSNWTSGLKLLAVSSSELNASPASSFSLSGRRALTLRERVNAPGTVGERKVHLQRSIKLVPTLQQQQRKKRTPASSWGWTHSDGDAWCNMQEVTEKREDVRQQSHNDAWSSTNGKVLLVLHKHLFRGKRWKVSCFQLR